MSSKKQKNVIVKKILVTDLSQQLRKDRNFLRWMARKYEDINPVQAQAFRTGAEILERNRQQILAGDYDAAQRKELFTRDQQRRSSS